MENKFHLKEKKKNKLFNKKKQIYKYINRGYEELTCINLIFFKLFSFFFLLFIYLIENNTNISKKINKYIKSWTNNISVCLCVIARHENLYAKEYVNHYKKLGYNHIFIYDNNDKDGERFEDVIQKEINSGFVSILDWRGNRGYTENEGPQLDVYRDCYEKNNKYYDWLSFHDFDEFLEIYPKNLKIQDFLGNERYKHCQSLKLNFLMFSDNDLLYYDNRPLQVRFTEPLYTNIDNTVIKSTIRGGLKENYWKNAKNTHTSLMNITSCNTNGEIIDNKSMFNKKYNFTYAALKHYYPKSLEEYVRKLIRGRATLKYTPLNTNEEKHKRMKNFFYYSKKTEEKVNLYKKLLNIT